MVVGATPKSWHGFLCIDGCGGQAEKGKIVMEVVLYGSLAYLARTKCKNL